MCKEMWCRHRKWECWDQVSEQTSKSKEDMWGPYKGLNLGPSHDATSPSWLIFYPEDGGRLLF